MFTSVHVANNFLYKAFNEDIKITPMKLQKLLYFVYREYLIKTGQPLFGERFEAWQYGPVLDVIYNHFKKYRSKSIKEYYQDNEGRSFMVHENCDVYFSEAINRVWDKYKNHTGIELSKITHKEGTAWYKAVKYRKTYLDDNDILEEGALT